MKDKYFKAILDNSPESIVLIGKNHEVLSYNKTIRDVLFQYHNREIKEGDLYYPDFVIEANRELYLEAFSSAKNGIPFITQNLTKGEGISYWFEYKMLPVYYDGELLGVTLSAKNITTEKEAEIKIADLSEKLMATLDNTDESITFLDLDYKILLMNKIAAKTIKQVTLSNAFIGNDFRDFIPDKSNLFYKYYPRAIKGESHLVEISYLAASNEIFWYQTKFNPVYNEKRQLIGVSIFAKDITEKKKIELELKESELRFQQITNLAPIGVFITDNSLKIEYANFYAKDLLSYNENEINGLSLTKIIENLHLGDDNKVRVGDLNLGIESPLFHQEQFIATSKNNQQFKVLLSSASQINQHKESYIFIIQDITELQNKNSLIDEQNNRLNDIAWYQSHIIRAPLARIMGIINLLEDNKISEQERNYLYKAVIDSSHELDKVIHDIVNKLK